MRKDYVSISPAQLRAGGQQDIDYMLDRPPFTRYYWNGGAFKEMGAASGADYLGPQTMAQLQAGAYADGTPELAALAKDTVVYLTDRGHAVTPTADGTHWSTGASGDRYTPAELAALATPLRAGTLVADADGVIYGQSDGAGGYGPVGIMYPDTTAALAPQFSLIQRCQPVKSRIIAATGALNIGPCAIVGVRCVGKGSAGTFTLHDDTGAATAAKLRMSIAQAAATDGTYYPACDSSGLTALLLATDAYITNTTGGAWVVDYLDDDSAIPGTEGSGLLCEPVHVAASGIALAGPAHVLSVKILAPGSAGNFAIYDALTADAARLRYPVTANGSLAANQIIDLGARGTPSQFQLGVYVTVPTGGAVLINYLPR